MVGKFGKVMHTLLYSGWMTTKDLLYNTQNSTQCYIPAWLGVALEESGYMYMYGCAPSLFT